MPEPSDHTDSRPDDRARRRNKWILAGILAVTALALYVGIMVRLALG